MNRKRIVMTGMGIVSPLGNDIPSFQQGLFNNISGIEAISLFDTSKLNAKVAGEVKHFVASQHFSSDRLSLLDRYNQFSLVAARQAVQDALILVFVNPSFHYAVVFFTARALVGKPRLMKAIFVYMVKIKFAYHLVLFLKAFPAQQPANC